MNRRLCVAAAFATMTLVGATRVAASSILFSSLGPGNTFDPSGYRIDGTDFSGQVMAMPFVPNATLNLLDAVLPLSHRAGTNDPLAVYLETSVGNAPGSILDTLTQSALPVIPDFATGGTLITFDCGLCPLLNAGTTYWLVAATTTSTSSQVWQFVTGEPTGPMAFNLAHSVTGPWTSFANFDQAAFRIDGGTPVPEPATMSLLSLGLASLGARRLRRGRGR